MEQQLKSRTIAGLAWSFAQRVVGQATTFAVTVVLARLLLPEDYGVVALASMFNILIGVFLGTGLGTALVQKKDVDDLDCDTVFWTNLAFGAVVYLVIFLAAPLAAALYHKPLITPLMRVMALTIPVGALGGVQNATLERELMFRRFFWATLASNSVSAVVGIAMACAGYGPWALVAQGMAAGVAGTAVMFCIVRWKPRLRFSRERFRTMFSFAWKNQAAGAIGTLCFQLKGYLIGYRYSTADLAFFNRGEGVPDMFLSNVNGTINGVLFPSLAKLQGDPAAVKSGIRRAMMTSSYVLAPMLLGLAAVADHLVPLLYSERWAPSVPFMQVACCTALVTILNTANLQALLAIGRADEILRLEMYKKPVMLAILAATVFISPLAISMGLFVYALYVLAMNTRPNRKHIGYSIREQVSDVRPNILLASAMAVAVYALGRVMPGHLVPLLAQMALGAALYTAGSWLTGNESFLYVRGLAINYYHRKIHHRP